MNSYVISILGIVVLGIIIDVIVPNGTINKYIRSIYAIFIVAVILSPLINFMKSNDKFSFNYKEYEINRNLINYIYTSKKEATENSITQALSSEGIEGVEVILNISTDLEKLTYVSCLVNLENMTNKGDKPHINSYEIITKLVKEFTGLKSEEIIISE